MIKTVILGGGIALGIIGFAMYNQPETYEELLNGCLDAGFPVKHCQERAIAMVQKLKENAAPEVVKPAAFLPPCATEDSENCYWDALERGYGQGTSFVSYKGKWYYMDPAPICTTDAVCEMMYPPAP